jgi:TRAP-type C4-dicarboxylate transport system permease small subunit
MKESVRWIFDKLFVLEAAAATIAYAVVGGLLLLDIIGREFFGTGIYGAQKYAVYAAILAAFLGLAMATAKGQHLRAEAMDAMVPQRWSQVADRFGYFLSFVLFAGLVWVSFQFMLDTRQLGMRAAVIGLPLWLLQIVLPYAFGSSALRNLAYAIYPTLAPQRQIEDTEAPR